MDYSTKFFKHYDGSEKADNCLVRIADDNYILFVGHGTDPDMGGTGYRWRKGYNHKPTIAEVRKDIEALINQHVAERILGGMTYEGDPVWLSEENQLNFRSTPSVPVRFKIGEDNEGKPVYRTFTTQKELNAFCKAVADWVNSCLNEGWTEKDGVDYAALVGENRNE